MNNDVRTSSPSRRGLLGAAGMLSLVATGSGVAAEAHPATDEKNAGGELVNVLKAGYAELIGLRSGHRYARPRGDDLRCVLSGLVRPVAEAFHQAVLSVLA